MIFFSHPLIFIFIFAIIPLYIFFFISNIINCSTQFKKKVISKIRHNQVDMGQTVSTSCKDFIPDAIGSVQFQIRKHSKIFSDINDMTYENFKKSIDELNELSRKCIDNSGNQLIFAICKGSDQIQWLWKATIKIACVSINPTSRKILNIKVINLKQFLHIFRTMVTNIEAIEAIEERQRSANSSPSNLYPTIPFNFNECINVDNDDDDDDEGCIICQSRKPEVILSCLHSFCSTCIEEWNQRKSNCPICDQKLNNIKLDSWENIEIPNAVEINEEIVIQLQNITSDK